MGIDEINIFDYIDVERTIAEFGYDPRELSKGSIKKVYAICIMCKKQKGIRNYQGAVKNKRCRDCAKIDEEEIIDEEVFKRIDINKTIDRFGYDPRKLASKSSRKVFCFCSSCGKARGAKIFRSVINSSKGNCCKKINIETKEQSLNQISINLTKKKFGYNPKHLKEKSEKLVIFCCFDCNKEVISKFRSAIKSKRCRSCANKAIRIDIKQSGRKILFNKNKGRKASKEARENMSKAKAGGKPTFGKGEWYTKKDGTKVYLRSSWERKFAEWLDEQNKNWEYEIKAFLVSYYYQEEKIRRYYKPDFFIDGEWIEIKGWWRDDAKPKFEAFKEQYPDEKITLLMKPELLALGIDVK